jgi:hypothetical protein
MHGPREQTAGIGSGQVMPGEEAIERFLRALVCLGEHEG